MAKVSTKDWRNLPVVAWNTTTFGEYMKDKHLERFGVPYVTSVVKERAMLKKMMTEFGNVTVMRFIDKCFETYKPSAQYAGVNFIFMYSYMRHNVQAVIAQEKQSSRFDEIRKKQAEKMGNMDNYF